jgi:hypothetical protein
MFWTPGNRFGPEKKPARGPLSLLTETVHSSGLPLADVWVPLVGPRQSSSISSRNSRRRPFPVTPHPPSIPLLPTSIDASPRL